MGAIYGLGFLLGYLSFDGRVREPAYRAWGDAFAGGHGGAILLWLAVASALVAWFWRASGTAYLDRRVVFASDVQRGRLIVAGPFRYVRNPLYLGNMFLAFSVALLAPPLGCAIILLGNAAFLVLLASEESQAMADRYGAEYEAFRAAVPAFVPRLTPAPVAASEAGKPAWAPALFGDAYCLFVAIALVPVALYGSAGMGLFFEIVIPTFVIWAALGWWAGRMSR